MKCTRRTKKKNWKVDDLDELRRSLKIIDANLKALTLTYGTFVGLNRSDLLIRVNGSAATSLNTIMFDQLIILAFRVNALISEPKQRTDISLHSFHDALGSPELMRALETHAREWGMGLAPERQAAAFQSRVAFLHKRFNRLESLDLNVLQRFRNKALAHITTEANSVRRPYLNTIWRSVRLSIAIGYDLHLIFGDGIHKDYIGMGKLARNSARDLVSQLKSSIGETT